MLSAAHTELLMSRMEWEERWLELEAVGRVDLPGYPGSTLRGALGTVMRPALCARGGECGEQCESPGTCPFFSLFEQSRAGGVSGGGQGPNIPKPLILESPLVEGLRAIAVGGAVVEPYELSGAGAAIAARERVAVEPGSRVRVGLRALGAAGAALDGIVEGVRRSGGLEVKGGRLRLAGVEARRGGLTTTMAMPLVARRVRLALVTPTLINGGAAGTCFDPVVLGRMIPDQALIRAVSLYNAFLRGPREEKIPFVEPRWPGAWMTAHRLFRYQLRRRSYRQDKWMDFDGVVGWMEWEGPGVGAMVPWLRAAEALHVGQKATFGLGRVELLLLE